MGLAARRAASSRLVAFPAAFRPVAFPAASRPVAFPVGPCPAAFRVAASRVGPFRVAAFQAVACREDRKPLVVALREVAQRKGPRRSDRVPSLHRTD